MTYYSWSPLVMVETFCLNLVSALFEMFPSSQSILLQIWLQCNHTKKNKLSDNKTKEGKNSISEIACLRKWYLPLSSIQSQLSFYFGYCCFFFGNDRHVYLVIGASSSVISQKWAVNIFVDCCTEEHHTPLNYILFINFFFILILKKAIKCSTCMPLPELCIWITFSILHKNMTRPFFQ